MESSILTSIKKLLGIEKDYEHFDQEIIIHINSAFMNLNQLGIGPKSGFSIENDEVEWYEFLGERYEDLQAVKTYIYLKVKLLFDPPQMGYLVDAITKQVSELEWRLNVQAEGLTLDEIESSNPQEPPEIPGSSGESFDPTDLENRIIANEENISALSIGLEQLSQNLQTVSDAAATARNIADLAAIKAATAGERAEHGIQLAQQALDQINQ